MPQPQTIRVPVDAPPAQLEAVLDALESGRWPPGTETWAARPEPVPESAAECEFGDAEYQWRLWQAGL